MRYTRFGQTDMDVSTACFGTWQLGGDWSVTEEWEMRRALNPGVNFFDTKGVLGMEDGNLLRDSNPDWLGLLGTECIDLYQTHWPDPDVRKNLEKVEDLERFAGERGHTIAQRLDPRPPQGRLRGRQGPQAGPHRGYGPRVRPLRRRPARNRGDHAGSRTRWWSLPGRRCLG